MIELKAKLEPQPSDETLLSVLEALAVENLIATNDLHSGADRLAEHGLVRISAHGRATMKGEPSNPKISGLIIHGGQIINYGHVGAIGDLAVGNIDNSRTQQNLDNSFDLKALSAEIDRIITELHNSAKTSDDYQRLQLLVEAKEQANKEESGKLIKTLSKMGESVMPIFAKFGAEELVKIMQQHLK